MPQQHEDVTVTWTDEDGVEQSTTMVQANFTSHGRFAFQKWQLCVKCGWGYPESQMRKIKGAWYCTKKKHYLDAPDTYHPH
jgi:hypothetical protein